MAVFDDLHGWDTLPYIGSEFYLEYGDFDYYVTVPADMLVAGSGELVNAQEVLTASQRSRLRQARAGDRVVIVRGADEIADPRSRPATQGSLTWHYRMRSTRDVAFAASRAFIWDAARIALPNGRAALAMSFYPVESAAADGWVHTTEYLRDAVQNFSRRWGNYPWPTAVAAAGPVDGMEYPAMVFDGVPDAGKLLFWITAHEIGHCWFPMMVGFNERRDQWMDEGFNTFIDLANAARYFKGTAYGDSIEVHPLHLYGDHAIAGKEEPLIWRPVEAHDLFWTGYQKPALMMQTLRYEVLGRDRFDHAFRTYLRAWAFKHPTPADFFRVMRDASGMDLDFFWRDWIYTTARLDQAVDSVASVDGDQKVFLSNRGTMTLPLEMELTYADGTTERVRLPVEMWNLGPRFAYRVRGGKRVTAVVVDPRNVLPDTDRGNNRLR
jgi:Peptidase family M1 domain